MRKFILFINTVLLSTTLLSCGGNMKQELEKRDKIYGYCENPLRDFNEMDYNICKAKERARRASNKNENMDPFNLTEMIEKVRSGGLGTNEYIKADINPFLWQGSIDVTSVYDLKIADASGGFIQTEWIFDKNALDKRCMIKIQIISADYVSTGVKSKFLCEIKDQEIWLTDGEEYFEEEKMLTLRILEASQKYSNSALN